MSETVVWLDRFGPAGVLGGMVWVAIYRPGRRFQPQRWARRGAGDLSWFLAAGLVGALLLLRLVAHGHAASRPA